MKKINYDGASFAYNDNGGEIGDVANLNNLCREKGTVLLKLKIHGDN